MPNSPSNYEISAPALHAADVILSHFDIVEKRGGKIKFTKKNLAILIDVTTDIFRVEDAIDRLVRENPWNNAQALKENMARLQHSIRAVELVRNRLPKYNRADTQVPFSVKERVEREVSHETQKRIQEIGRQVTAAKTVDDQQKVLRAAGIVR